MGCVTKDNFGQLQRLNAVLFPVQYSDKFYRDSYAEEVRPITHLAFHHDVLIGAVCCKFDQPTLTAEKILKRVRQTNTSAPAAPHPLMATLPSLMT